MRLGGEAVDSKKKGLTGEPEVLDRELEPVSGRPPRPLRRGFFEFSANPVKNAIRSVVLDGYRDVVKAENELLGSLLVNEGLKDRLNDIGTELEAERLERQNRRNEAVHRATLATKEHLVEGLRLDVEAAELQQRLRALQGQNENSLEERLTQKNAEKALKRKYAILREMEEIEQLHFLKAEKIGKLNELIRQVRAGDLPEEEREEQIQEIERLILKIEQGV